MSTKVHSRPPRVIFSSTGSRVVPATSVPVVLKAQSSNGPVEGQVNVSAADRVSGLTLVPVDAPAPPEAVEAILRADQVVLGPGSLYTSVLAAVVVPELRWREAAPLWSAAEELGFDHAWTYDHLVWGGLPDSPVFAFAPTLALASTVTATYERASATASS